LGKGPLTSNLVFLRLADMLEHNLEGGMFYNQKAMKENRGLRKRIPPYVIQAANVLGLPGLTQELERVEMENDSLQPLDHLYKKFGGDGGFTVNPPSYAQKNRVRLLRVLARFWHGGGPSWSMGPLKKLIHHGLS